MSKTSFFRSAKKSLRRATFRAALGICSRGRDGRLLVFQELESLGPIPGRIIHGDGENVLVEGGDHVVWCRSDDTLVAAGLFKHGHWQRDDYDAVLTFLKNKKRLTRGAFVNIGANIGTQVLYAALGNQFTRTIAYEPEVKNFALLERNIATNGFATHARVIRAAVSSHADGVRLRLDAERPGMTHVTEDTSGALVPSVRLSENLAELDLAPFQIALIWIDVEGHEWAVFQGMHPHIDAQIPILFEFSKASVSDETRIAWRNSLAARYTTIASVDRGKILEMPFEKPSRSTSQISSFADPRLNWQRRRRVPN